MTEAAARRATVGALDDPTRELVRLAAVVTVFGEQHLRRALAAAAEVVPAEWVEELLLQSYLFAGFPRALNAMREWRRIAGRPAPSADEGERTDAGADWQARGETTCARVYGEFYHPLRRNIRALHPALDAWMVVDGYGKVLSRPALDLVRRELCIVAACSAAQQDRQLHSHLHGALNVGATPEMVEATLDALEDLVPADVLASQRLLWARVRGK